MSSMDKEITIAMNRLADAVERHCDCIDGLGRAIHMRYTNDERDEDGVLDETSMASFLGIAPRTLAGYRRRGTLPSCWIKNGKQIRWHVERTLAAWNEGVS